jgi:hypothetical protein
MSDGRAGDIMRYSFLQVFADDGTIDEAELAFMKRLALEDHEVDDAERRILGGIFERVKQDAVTPEVWAEIQEFKLEHGIA